nr:hypothetical protein [Shouchella patagoniensis]
MNEAFIRSIVLPVAFERAVNPLIQEIEKETPYWVLRQEEKA